jgi:ATP-dependent Zn protease
MKKNVSQFLYVIKTLGLTKIFILVFASIYFFCGLNEFLSFILLILFDAWSAARDSGKQIKKILSGEDKRRAAIHEAGHTIIAHELGLVVERVSIASDVVYHSDEASHRFVLGFTMSRNEKIYKSSEDILKYIQLLCGGWVAEKLILGFFSDGRREDLRTASAVLRDAFLKLGLSKTFGLLVLEDVDSVSERKLEALEKEIQITLQKAEAECKKILIRRRQQLEALAEILLREGELSGEKLKSCLTVL